MYRDCRLGEIRAERGNEFVELRVPGGEEYLRRGEAWGDVDGSAVAREMIRRTIREHLDKEKRLRPQGIKVLSLFFIDRVERYRRYEDDGSAVKGDYAVIFEEEYRRLANHLDYRTLFREVDLTAAAEDVHDGYFSIDRRRRWTDTAENNQGNRDNAERAYNLIMKDKEKLLSLDTPLKFIFSHSALREGWDNPNVFQICALRDVRTERERRQTIGRGLRLCVNRQGERVRGFDVNTLTVVARESYEEFAEQLQREIEEETRIRFGIVERHQFARIPVTGDDGATSALGFAASQELWQHLHGADYIDAHGRIQDSLREALKDDSFTPPERFAAQRTEIAEVLRTLAGRLDVKNADERKRVRPRQAVLQGAEFKELWDRIKHKTTYRVQFDNDGLVAKCARALQDAPPIPRTRLQWRKADIAIGQAGVQATERSGAATVVLDERDIPLPDVLTELQDRTRLTRRSIYRILSDSHRLDDFKRNPQAFIELAAQAINRCKRQAVVDGIKYQRLGDDHYYAQELFENEELTGYLRNMRGATKSVYEEVVYESDVEARFADQLEKNAAVKVYAKLPARLVRGADPARDVPPGLGRFGGHRCGDPAVSGGRDEGQPLRGRPSPHRRRQDQVRPRPLRGTGGAGPAGPLRGRDERGWSPCRHQLELTTTPRSARRPDAERSRRRQKVCRDNSKEERPRPADGLAEPIFEGGCTRCWMRWSWKIGQEVKGDYI